ncbi:MAG: valine--tRNA ligase [Candidatus Dasytiphilus stammeri]
MKNKYSPNNIEFPIYNYWEKNKFFQNKYKSDQENFCIMLPPPNITGTLHMGHAFQHTLIDTLIRYHRMQGKNTLWQVGTDHAGIATQIIIEQNILLSTGKNKKDLDQKELFNQVWEWKNSLNKKIFQQMRRLGCSADWERARFTMDEGFTRAVNEGFLQLYKDGLIYRGKRLVNWDPILRTAISDLEVEHIKSQGFIWYIRYPLADGMKTLQGTDYILVATTRPETLWGDTGIAINPLDDRYKTLLGKFVILPLVHRRLPIVADKSINMSTGSGCMKITPAHDFKDYEIAQRCNLPMINILNFDGTLRSSAQIFNSQGKITNCNLPIIPKEFHGLSRIEARKKILCSLKQKSFLQHQESYELYLPYGEKSKAIIEPMLTDQWYLRTRDLAKIAIEAVKQKKIIFFPQKYENIYFSWMSNIKDWCLSRQLWWGHRIPAWYDEQGQIYIARNEQEVRQQNNFSSNIILTQDNDVLDTWFSSGLWTFCTLGWPQKTDLLQIYHPTSVLVSGFDIIFFWISRMIMLSMYFMKDKDGQGQIPFKKIYITGLIKDEQGNKMSKSKGNVIDPLDIIDGISLEELVQKRTNHMLQPKLANNIILRTKKQFPKGIQSHGSDALRFTLTSLSCPSRNINFDLKRLEGYRKFCNKLWNAGKFVLQHTEQYVDMLAYPPSTKKTLSDRWILAEFNNTVKKYRNALDNYRLDLASNILYEFTWNQFCDWYLEITKIILKSNSQSCQYISRITLIKIFESLLRLAHPIIPFITEYLWLRLQKLMGSNKSTIMIQKIPSYISSAEDKLAVNKMELIKKIIIYIRKIKTKMNISMNQNIDLLIRPFNLNKNYNFFQENLELLYSFAQVKTLTIVSKRDILPVIRLTQIIEDIEIHIPLSKIIDPNIEYNRLCNELTKLLEKINYLEILLSNKQFLSSAPQEIILTNRRQLKILEEKKKIILIQQNFFSKNSK